MHENIYFNIRLKLHFLLTGLKYDTCNLFSGS